MQAIKREDWKRLKCSESRISKQRVCSFHFISGERSDDPDNIDWIPTKFTHAAAVPIDTLLVKKKNMEDRNKRARKRATMKLKNEPSVKKRKKKSCCEEAVNDPIGDEVPGCSNPALPASSIDFETGTHEKCYRCWLKEKYIKNLKQENISLKVQLQILEDENPGYFVE